MNTNKALWEKCDFTQIADCVSESGEELVESLDVEPATAFKILTTDQWEQFRADGVFHGAPVDLADGYIHLSTADQLQGTLDKHFAEQRGLVIAEIDLAVLGGTIIWEVSRGNALFPHNYGPLPMAAVLGSQQL